MMETKEFAPARFRSARPQSLANVNSLANSGVMKIVSLQGEILEYYQVMEERNWCDTAKIEFVHIPMNLLTCPTVDQIERALKEIGGYDTPGVSTLVHCHDGVDRTGVVCATWNMKGLGWTFGRAVGDMIDNGFHLNMYSFWLETLKEYFKAVEYRKPFLAEGKVVSMTGDVVRQVMTPEGLKWEVKSRSSDTDPSVPIPAKPKMGAEAVSGKAVILTPDKTWAPYPVPLRLTDADVGRIKKDIFVEVSGTIQNDLLKLVDDWREMRDERDKLKEAAKPKMGAGATTGGQAAGRVITAEGPKWEVQGVSNLYKGTEAPVDGSLVNGIIDAQVLGYLNAKLTAENLQGLIDRTGLTVQTTISQFLATMTGPTLAAELKNILLPLFQK